jgi:hypothetical protein
MLQEGLTRRAGKGVLFARYRAPETLNLYREDTPHAFLSDSVAGCNAD